MNCAHASTQITGLWTQLYSLSQVLSFLEGKGFSRAQIRRGLSLLMYPVAAVEAALERAAIEFPDDPPATSEHFLALVLYAMEREDEFSGDLIVVSCMSWTIN